MKGIWSPDEPVATLSIVMNFDCSSRGELSRFRMACEPGGVGQAVISGLESRIVGVWGVWSTLKIDLLIFFL